MRFILVGILLMTTVFSVRSVFAAQPRYVQGNVYESNCYTYKFMPKGIVEVTSSKRCALYNPGTYEHPYKFEDGKVKIDVGGGTFMVMPFDENGCLVTPGDNPACKQLPPRYVRPGGTVADAVRDNDACTKRFLRHDVKDPSSCMDSMGWRVSYKDGGTQADAVADFDACVKGLLRREVRDTNECMKSKGWEVR